MVGALLDYEDRRVLLATGKQKSGRKRGDRHLSEREHLVKMSYFNDRPEDYPPEEFYHFLTVKRNTRERIITTNKDIFLIFGQNGIISCLFVVSYLAVWLTKIGESKKKFLKVLVFM